MTTPSDFALMPRLPNQEVTIFTVMSALAQQAGAVNLGQGFPDFACDPRLPQAVSDAMAAGHNQYPPMAGLAALREAIANKTLALYGRAYDASTEVTVTAGATQALLNAIQTVSGPGDEVIVLDPCYDSYVPNIHMAGATPVRVPLTPGTFRPDFDRIAAALTPRTRALIINTPHNPSGTVWTDADMLALADLLQGTSVAVISDEVYEHMVYDGRIHQSVCRFNGLAHRSLVISSFGKTFHVTGWKVGYLLAPAEWSALFRQMHQYTVFTVNTPVQHALASYLEEPSHYNDLPAFYQRKRDLFRAGLARTRLRLTACEGTYFQCVGYQDLAVPERMLGERAFCEWLTTEVGVAAIPLSAFYGDGFEQGMVRLCFAKREDTLMAALTKLQAL